MTGRFVCLLVFAHSSFKQVECKSSSTVVVYLGNSSGRVEYRTVLFACALHALQ